MSKMSEKDVDRQETIKLLRERYGVRPGKRVYTRCDNVSRSGMSRHVHLFVISSYVFQGKKENRIFNITGLVAKVIDARRSNESGGIIRGGCGMDMGFDTVYHLGCVMFPKGGNVKYSTRRHQEERAGKTIESNGGYLLHHDSL